MNKLSQAELLSMLNGGADQAQVFGSLLGDRAESPLMKILLSRMSGQTDSESVDAAGNAIGDIEDGEFEELPNPRLAERRQRFRIRLKALRDELYALRRHNDELAVALGACCQCWGYDEKCPDCEGAGEPGWQEPDLGGFRRLVEPAIRRIKTTGRASVRPGNRVHHTQEKTP